VDTGRSPTPLRSETAVRSTLTIDIELTNHCNAACRFCPRDAMPHEGLMRPEVFECSLARAVEFHALARQLPTPQEPTIVFCGTGEPLVNRRTADYVRRVREAGLPCQLTTNGSLLSHEAATAMLDAGLMWINVSVSEIGEEYEQVYGLPFAQTRDNVLRFLDLAYDRCVVCIIVVDHRRDARRLRAIEDYWRSCGVDHVLRFGLVNRAGSLRLPDAAPLQPASSGEAAQRGDASEHQPICPAPFMHLFIGYDGRYYLCSSDWQKEVAFGSVFERSFAAITTEKLARVGSREPLCKRCTLDPINLLARRRQVADPTSSRPFDASIEDILANDRAARTLAAEVIAWTR
jgi:MoaA/NifB/PqqE/SkfB family radical SAM enzyme